MEENKNTKIIFLHFFILLLLSFINMYNCKLNLVSSHLREKEITTKPKIDVYRDDADLGIHNIKNKIPKTFKIEYDAEIKEDEIL